MSVFQALTLAIAFAMLVIEILKFNQKKYPRFSRRLDGST